jgi:lysozyme
VTVTGPDCSRYQGTVDWAAVRRAGHAFAIIKATEGTDYSYVDWYQRNAPRVEAAGLTLGAYHFLRRTNGAGQARYYAATVGSFTGRVAVLDVEKAGNGTYPTITDVREFAAEFRRLTDGHPLVVYTGRWFWDGYLKNPSGADIGPLWHSEYETSHAEVADGPEGDRYGGWPGATLWQWTSSGTCPGVSGRCDLNVLLRGSLADLTGRTSSAPTPTPLVPQEDDEVHFYVRVTDSGRGEVALGSPGYWNHLDHDQHEAVKALRGEPTPVTLDRYHQLRSACLHGERCANDATS